ncbi:MAG: hypothetical protein ACR2MG_02155 [Pyrinomonadaceae bacterium]
MANEQEIWQVDVNGEIYETNFEGLANWIAEGSLMRQDKVRRGNLRWLEAGKIPLLYSFFNAKELGVAPPVVSTTNAQTSEENLQNQTENFATSQNVSENNFNEQANEPTAENLQTDLTEVNHQQNQIHEYKNAVTEGFGFADFAKALAYPFKFKASLIFGAIFFMVFSLGQSVWIFGGFMFVSAIFCAMLANTLTFGVLANTVENFSQGKIESDFMPRFDDFSAWDDVIHPFLLSIGVYLVSFGLLIALVIGATWYAMKTLVQIDEGKEKIVSSVLPVPPNDFNLANQSAQVNQLTEQIRKQNKFKDGNMPDENAIAQSQSNTSSRETNFQNQIKQSEQTQIEAITAKETGSENNNLSEMPGNVMRLSLVFSIPIFLAFLWGVFYFPAACAVAAYTRSFTATLNPLIGFDTIKRLGLDYAKILIICLILGTFVVVINGFLGKIFAPLDLPQMGNLPVKSLIGLLYFYFSVVFSVILGFVIYKNSRRLNLHRS